MRELNFEEIEQVSGGAGITPVEGITLVLGTLGVAAAVAAATPVVVGIGVVSIVTMAGIAIKGGSGPATRTTATVADPQADGWWRGIVPPSLD